MNVPTLNEVIIPEQKLTAGKYDRMSAEIYAETLWQVTAITHALCVNSEQSIARNLRKHGVGAIGSKIDTPRLATYS